MPKGSKAKYTDKQKRQAEYIKKNYEDREMPKGIAKIRAWKTVNKQSGGGAKFGAGRRVSGKTIRPPKKYPADTK
jgi:hypothetical protein